MNVLLIFAVLCTFVLCVSPLLLRALEKRDRTYMRIAFIFLAAGVALWIWLWRSGQ